MHLHRTNVIGSQLSPPLVSLGLDDMRAVEASARTDLNLRSIGGRYKCGCWCADAARAVDDFKKLCSDIAGVLREPGYHFTPENQNTYYTIKNGGSRGSAHPYSFPVYDYQRLEIPEYEGDAEKKTIQQFEKLGISFWPHGTVTSRGITYTVYVAHTGGEFSDNVNGEKKGLFVGVVQTDKLAAYVQSQGHGSNGLVFPTAADRSSYPSCLYRAPGLMLEQNKIALFFEEPDVDQIADDIATAVVLEQWKTLAD